MAKVLVVDDEPKLGALVQEILELDGHAITRVGGGRQALIELASQPFEIVLTDLKMPEIDGLAVLKTARALATPPEVIVMTAFGTAETAVAAMKLGAADYLTKPFSMDELRLRVRRLGDQRDTVAKSNRLQERLTPVLVAESAAMKAALVAARQVAASDATVLLLGESGTGKSQLARYIHYSGKRASRPLIEVHCAALPESLLESELFGHEKGSFTGANEKRTGHLASADHGTLFLDEIGEITQATQVKLLRFLQDREYVSIGSSAARKVDVRVVAATNRDVGAAVKAGTFRQDFYYRLNVFAIQMPSLRDRKEDISPLCDHFLTGRGIPPARLGAKARERLQQRGWPGNIRELENALERALILAGDGEIKPEHVDEVGVVSRMSGPGDLLTPGFNLDAHERSLLYAALERAGGNKTAAAKLLGITRRRLYSRLESLDDKAAEAEAETPE